MHSHAVMFHHFHSLEHLPGQGSLSADQFCSILDWLVQRYCLLNAEEYFHKFLRGELKSSDVCLTFDDALLCQIDVAAPILKKRNIQAFFFVYSSPFNGRPDFLEIFRYFRNVKFDSIDDFYKIFFENTELLFLNEYSKAKRDYNIKDYLKDFRFYTENDKWFRYLRDIALGKERYEEVMILLMKKYGFEHGEVANKLWMNDEHLKNLRDEGNIIGLHSYSHPTALHTLPKAKQQEEYQRNYDHLKDILGAAPISMSHPCGNYNDDTLDILQKMGIKIGFRSNRSTRTIKSNLEIPREDHVNVLMEMEK